MAKMSIKDIGEKRFVLTRKQLMLLVSDVAANNGMEDSQNSVAEDAVKLAETRHPSKDENTILRQVDIMVDAITPDGSSFNLRQQSFEQKMNRFDRLITGTQNTQLRAILEIVGDRVAAIHTLDKNDDDQKREDFHANKQKAKADKKKPAPKPKEKAPDGDGAKGFNVDPDAINGMTARELQAFCRTNGVPIGRSTKKADLIKRILDAANPA